MILALVARGQRLKVTAVSNRAVLNLLVEVVKAARERGMPVSRRAARERGT